MKKKTGFEKFFKGKKAGAVKEELRQEKRKIRKEREEEIEKKRVEKAKVKTAKPVYNIPEKAPDAMPLNKYIAHCGVCSRRDAVEVIKSGKVKVNNVVVTEPGHKIQPGDTVTHAGKKIQPVKGLVYILLNKPKDYITTTDD
ncbi:MAG TPA: S4 domain-containing protein, partial [Chitinophagaceae bacterium]|nr:S4 domain-containing protein [Chitinophagaceae bacterium]